MSRHAALKFHAKLFSTLIYPFPENDPILLVGDAALFLLRRDPDKVQILAYEHIHAHEFDKVPLQWRRLYEEATLWIALSIINTLMRVGTYSISKKDAGRPNIRYRSPRGSPKQIEAEWLICSTHLIHKLDTLIILTGAPGRKNLIDELLGYLSDGGESLENLKKFDDEDTSKASPGRVDRELMPPPPKKIRLQTEKISFQQCKNESVIFESKFYGKMAKVFPRPPKLPLPIVNKAIPRVQQPSLYWFEKHVVESESPLILTGTLNTWPAMHRWKQIGYWLALTNEGRRLVPVEIGKSYTDEQWTQKIVHFGTFIQEALLGQKQNDLTEKLLDEAAKASLKIGDLGFEHDLPVQLKSKISLKTAYLAQYDLFSHITALRRDFTIPDYCYTSTNQIPSSPIVPIAIERANSIKESKVALRSGLIENQKMEAMKPFADSQVNSFEDKGNPRKGCGEPQNWPNGHSGETGPKREANDSFKAGKMLNARSYCETVSSPDRTAQCHRSENGQMSDKENESGEGRHKIQALDRELQRQPRALETRTKLKLPPPKYESSESSTTLRQDQSEPPPTPRPVHSALPSNPSSEFSQPIVNLSLLPKHTEACPSESQSSTKNISVNETLKLKHVDTLREHHGKVAPDHKLTSSDPPPVVRETEREGIQGTDSSPLLNIWLGPRGTVSDAHTDPHHNILAQVVGRKYLRLFAPSQTPKMYPREGERWDMSNTSSIDVGAKVAHDGDEEHIRADPSLSRYADTEPMDLDKRKPLCGEDAEIWEGSLQNRSREGSVPATTRPYREDLAARLENSKQIDLDFPEHASAEYVDCILEEGECIYIPKGWWHYVRSLETSISISFWWD